MYNARNLGTKVYNDLDYTNEQSIAYMRLAIPDKINRVLTYTYSETNNKFPLSMITEGNGLTESVNDVQFTWDVMGKPAYNDVIVKAPVAVNGKLGYGGSIIEVEFKSRRMIEQFGLIGPDGESRVRIMEKPVKGEIGYIYRLKSKNPDPESSLDSDLFAVGKYWTMTISTVPESFSRGNRATSMAPTKMHGQVGFHRFTKQIAGNAANKVVQYEFRTEGGGTTNLWINEELRQFDQFMRIMREEQYWLGRYNRLPDGTITMLDVDTENPIPESLGMFEIAEANYDTYGEKLYTEKIDRTIMDVLSTDTDSGNMEVVLYAGKGGRLDFHDAIMDKSINLGFTQALGDKFINGSGESLSFGGNFDRYRTPDGHYVTVKDLPIVNKGGSLGDNDISNGNIHPRTGLPLSSHTLIFADHSYYSGKPNIRTANMKGQEWIEGLLEGMSPVPPSWGVVPVRGKGIKQLGTDVDMGQYEVKMSSGLQVDNAEKFFTLKCKL